MVGGGSNKCILRALFCLDLDGPLGMCSHLMLTTQPKSIWSVFCFNKSKNQDSKVEFKSLVQTSKVVSCEAGIPA